MANVFPCPNAACTYQFDADQLPAAAMVTCPVCRTRFPYRSAATAPKARPSSKPEEPAWHEQQAESAEPFESRPRERTNWLVNSRNVPKGNKAGTILMLMLFAAVGVGALIIIVMTMKKNPFGGDPASGENYVDQTFNFKFVNLNNNKAWAADESLKGRLGTNGFLMRRNDPEAWIGLRAWPIDGGKRNARPEELTKELTTMLRRNFGGNSLETTAIAPTIAGMQPKDAVEFKGELDGTPVWGEALAFDNKGIGYVFLIYSPLDQWDRARDELIKLRNSFSFSSLRDNWKSQEAEIKDYFADNGNYQVSDPDVVWKRAVPEPKEGETGPKSGDYVRSPADADPKATMLFLAKYPEKNSKRNRLPEADAMVLVFDKADGDPLEFARKYIHEKLQKVEGENVEIKFEQIKQPPAGIVVPKSEAQMGIYYASNNVNKEKSFYAISAMTIGDKMVAAIGWCPRADEEAMGRFILNLVASLRERK